MSAWATMGAGTRALVVAAGGVVLAGAGYLVWQSAQPAVVAELAAVAPEVVVAATPVEAPEPVAPLLPKIDTWRVAADGEALVAGKAAPGATVAVVVDDIAVAEGVALASGDFVLQFTLPPNPAPSLLWLSMTAPDGSPVASPEMVAIAPIAGPVVAATGIETVPEVAAEPATDTALDAAPDAVADPAPTALLVTEEGAVVLQGDAASGPPQMSQVMIDTISYAPSGAVQVGGRGGAGAALRLYLDNAEVAVSSVPEDGRWQVTLGDTAPGVYTLRVDQIDAAGKVTARFETPFKRETLETLAKAAGSADGTAASPEGEVAVETPAETPAEPTATAEASAPAVSAAAPVATAEASPAPPITITVQPGFTLWGIAQDRMGDGVMYVQVYDANREKIRDPNLIYPGQVFTLPASPPP